MDAAEGADVQPDEWQEAGVAKRDGAEDDRVEDRAVDRGVGVIGIKPSERRRGEGLPA